MEMRRSKKGMKERSRKKSRISFFVIKYAQFAHQELVNRNWNNLLDNESGRKKYGLNYLNIAYDLILMRIYHIFFMGERQKAMTSSALMFPP